MFDFKFFLPLPATLTTHHTCERLHYGGLILSKKHIVVVVSVLPLGRFLASMFSILSFFPPFYLIPHTMLLSETHLAYPIIFFPLVFFLSSDPLSPSLAGFHL